MHFELSLYEIEAKILKIQNEIGIYQTIFVKWITKTNDNFNKCQNDTARIHFLS